MEKCKPVTTQPIRKKKPAPPPYKKVAKEGNAEKAQCEQEAIHGDNFVNVLQQPPQDQALPQVALPQAPVQQVAAVSIVQQPTSETTLCECDGSWWGFCCLSLWFLGIGSLVADCKIHGSATCIGWGLAIMGILKWTGIILLIFGFFISGPIGIRSRKLKNRVTLYVKFSLIANRVYPLKFLTPLISYFCYVYFDNYIFASSKAPLYESSTSAWVISELRRLLLYVLYSFLVFAL